jgi:hypothetical protein
MPPANPASAAPPAIRGVFAFEAALETACAVPPACAPALRPAVETRRLVERSDPLREPGAARERFERFAAAARVRFERLAERVEREALDRLRVEAPSAVLR